MIFTKSVSDRLHGIFEDKALEMGSKRVEWTSMGGPITQTDNEWRSLIAHLGVTELSRDDLRGDADRFRGKVIIDNPRALQGYGYLLVSKEIAEKILVLGHLPSLEKS